MLRDSAPVPRCKASHDAWTRTYCRRNKRRHSVIGGKQFNYDHERCRLKREPRSDERNARFCFQSHRTSEKWSQPSSNCHCLGNEARVQARTSLYGAPPAASALCASCHICGSSGRLPRRPQATVPTEVWLLGSYMLLRTAGACGDAAQACDVTTAALPRRRTRNQCA